MAGNVKEIVIYIHGVSPEAGSHEAQYQALHDAIQACHPVAFPQEFCGVEWGWSPTPATAAGHELLSEAETKLGGQLINVIEDASDFTINPLRLVVGKVRQLFLYAISDMFYYVSRDGKNEIRYALSKAIIDHLKQQQIPDVSSGPPLSLTFVAHSAGTVAAFDFLFYLFYKPRTESEFIELDKVQAGPSATTSGVPAATAIQRASPAAKNEVADQLNKLKQMANNGRLRVRRLFTFGSPISPLAFRANSILKELANGRPLKCENYGLTDNPAAFGPALTGPRWINMWEKDDPIAWPVQPLMNNAGNGVILDDNIDVSDNPGTAHTDYWEDKGFQQRIADKW